MSALDTLRAEVGILGGTSPWVVITQAQIDAFADLTQDRQFIHIDPVRAAATPFGGTVAHGFLTLSMLSHLLLSADLPLPSARESVNYGFDRVRFLAPVPAGARIRGVFVLTGVEDRGGGRMLLRFDATVEIDGSAKPALRADWLAMMRMDEAP